MVTPTPAETMDAVNALWEDLHEAAALLGLEPCDLPPIDIPESASETAILAILRCHLTSIAETIGCLTNGNPTGCCDGVLQRLEACLASVPT